MIFPAPGKHTLSPCSGPDEMDTFIHRLESLSEGIIYVGFKLNKSRTVLSPAAVDKCTSAPACSTTP